MTEEKLIQDLRKIFLYVKGLDGNFEYVFLSQRFLNIYQYILKKYPEILLPNYCLYDDKRSTKWKKIYLNDINYELPTKKRLKDRIYLYNFCFNYACIFYDEKIPIVTESDRQIAFNGRKEFTNLEKNPKINSVYWSKKVVGRDILDTLGVELKLLADFEIIDPIHLLPDFFQNYFRFVIFNQEYLRFFLNAFYASHSVSYGGMNHYKLLTDLIVDDMIQLYGKENINSELIEFLLKHYKYGYFNMCHYPLNQKLDNFESYDYPIIEDGKLKRIGSLENK